jgi:hypothetical protein
MLMRAEVIFETRAIYVWHIAIFAILCLPMAASIFATVRGITGWPVLLIFFGSLFVLFLYSILFGKLKVYKDGISFRMRYISFNDVDGIRFKCGGRVLVLGKWMDWFILFNSEGFVEAVKTVKPEILTEYKKPVRRRKPIIYPVTLLAPLMVLWMIERILSYIGIAIDAFTWSLVWGITAFLSGVAWTYWLPPHRWRVLGLGRLGTSIIMGLIIGIPIFLIMLTKVFTR